MAHIPSSDLDQWIETLSGCKVLEEEKLKLLCDYVRILVHELLQIK